MRYAWWIALAACSGAPPHRDEPLASPTQPTVTPRRALALDGPHETLDAACRDAGACTVSGRPNRTLAVTCSAVNAEPAPTLTFDGSGTPVRIAPRSCSAPVERRLVAEHYDLYLEAPDGWYRSPSLFAIEYGSRMCSIEVNAKWERRAPHVIATVTFNEQCYACVPRGKPPAKARGNRSVDFVVVIDTRRRIVYDPIPVGWRTNLEPHDPSAAQDCLVEERIDVARTRTWTDGRLVLGAAPSWAEPDRSPDGWSLHARARGAIGEQTYSFD